MLNFLVPLITSLISGLKTAGMKMKSPVTGAMGQAPSAFNQAIQSAGGWGGIVGSILSGGSKMSLGGGAPMGSQDFGQVSKPVGIPDINQDKKRRDDFFTQVIMPLLLKQMR